MTANGDRTGDSASCPMPAIKLRRGDLVLLGDFAREVVHVQKFGAHAPAGSDTDGDGGASGSVEVHVRVLFVNGGSVIAPAGETFVVLAGDRK